MPYLTTDELKKMGFKAFGKNVKISTHANIYNPELISIGDNSRIDDYCVISGNISIGRYVHIGALCLIAGGEPGIVCSDFTGISYGSKVFAQSDDYSGEFLTSPLIPKKFKREQFQAVYLGKHVIIGANSVILPGVNVAEGCSIGAMTLVNKSTDPWGIYVGSPAYRLKDRNKGMLELEKQFLDECK